VNNKTNITQTERKNGLGSTYITVSNNIIYGGDAAATIVGPTSNHLWEGNIIFKTVRAGDMPNGSFINADPKLYKDATGSYHLRKGSPAIDAAKGACVNITVDMDGQARGTKRDVGADEVSKSKTVAGILMASDVGHMAGTAAGK
jgi:poly(beta-D-mannuronate) lyase